MSQILSTHPAEVRRALSNHAYEAGPDGLLLARQKVRLTGCFTHEARRHPLLARALASGDPERVDWSRRLLGALKRSGRLDRAAFQPVGEPAVDHNLTVNEGINSLLDVGFHGSPQITNWYVGVFKGNYTPVATVTAATIATAATEATEYDEPARVAWNEGAAASQSISNAANRATFTVNATVTLYGAFLVSSNQKNGTGGVLWSAARFASARPLVDDDELLITFQIAGQDV